MNSRKNPNPVFAAPTKKMSPEGSAAAMRRLALIYLQDKRTDKEYGRSLLLAAGRAADRVASRLLADYYLAGRFGFPKDEEQSTYWWLRSERRLWSEQSPLYRYKLWKLSWKTGETMSALA